MTFLICNSKFWSIITNQKSDKLQKKTHCKSNAFSASLKINSLLKINIIVKSIGSSLHSKSKRKLSG